MNIKLLSSQWGELEFKKEPAYSDQKQLIPGATSIVSADARQNFYFQFHELQRDGFTLRLSDYRSKQKAGYTLLADPLTTFRFALHHSHQFYLPILGLQTFHERSFNLLYIPEVSTEFNMHPDELFIYLDIILSQSWMEGFKQKYPQLFDAFIIKAAHKVPAKLCLYNQVATIEVLRWVDEIMQYCYADDKSDYDINNSVHQLLDTALSAMQHQPAKRPMPLSWQEVEKIYRLTRLLEESSETCAINELSEIFDIRPHKLKRIFKEVYGHSLLQHRNEEKMRLALRLVNDPRYNRKQVVAKLAYKNAADFSRDFKKRFGYPPYRK